MIDVNKIIDISMDLDERTVVWTADPQPKLIPIARQPKDECNFTWLDFGSHAGTHIDAPFYLFKDKWTSDQIPFDRMIGRCQVLDMTSVSDTITEEDLKKVEIKQKIVLFKTLNYLVSIGVYTVGFDYQTIEREGKNELHKIFMSQDVISIDNLRLGHVDKGEYDFICLPIKVIGIDAGPARALLIKD